MMTHYCSKNDLLKSFLAALVLFFLITEVHSSPVSSDAVQVYAYELDYRLSENGTTQYNLLLKHIIDKGLNIKALVRPLPRTHRKILSDTNACVFPAAINSLKKIWPELNDYNLIKSYPIDRISLRVFTKTNNPIITNLKQLDGKRLAYWNGLTIEQLIPPELSLTLETTPNEEVRVKMLEANRIDAILGFIPDVLLAAEDLELNLPKYDKNLALFHEAVSLICHENEKTTHLIEQFNKIISDMKKTGKLKEILGPHADIVY